MRATLRSDLGRKATVYFSALLLNTLLGLVVYVMLTRSMSVADFGTYSFVIAIFLFVGMFFDFGIASAGMRLMALLRDGEDAARRIGALLMLSVLVGIGFVLVAIAASFAVDSVFGKNAGAIILMAAPLTLVYPLQEMVLSISQGSSRMRFMSVFLVLPRVLLIAALAFLLLTGGIDARMAVLATLVTLGAAVGIAVGYMRPVFTNLGSEFRMIFREVREYGRDIYLGRVVDGMTTGLDKMLLSYFHGMVPVGFYSIAMTMSTPISMPSKAMAQSAYRRFVSDDSIADRLLLLNVLWCTVGAALLLVACQLLIPLFFTDRYSASLVVVPWLMAGFALAGLNHPFHAFLAAHRQGRSIRIMSMTSSGVNIALNFALIPGMGMTGAALALLATYLVNIVMNLHFYRELRIRSANADATQADATNPEGTNAEGTNADGAMHG